MTPNVNYVTPITQRTSHLSGNLHTTPQTIRPILLPAAAESVTRLVSRTTQQVGGFFVGVGKVVGETVKGTYELAKNMGQTYNDVTYGKYVDIAGLAARKITEKPLDRPEWLPNTQRGIENIEKGGRIIKGIAENPKILWDAIADPIDEDWNAGRYGEAIGRGTAELAGVLLGTKGADKLGTASKSAKAIHLADDVPDAHLSKKAEQSSVRLNHQGIPLDLVNDAAKYTGKSIQSIEKMYNDLKNVYGIDYNAYLDKFVKNNEYGITTEDAHYIFAYTTDLFYAKMNRELRSTGKLSSQAGESIYNNLLTSLEKLPDSSGVYYRHLEELTETGAKMVDEKYALGNIIHERAFQSAADAPSPDYQNGISRTLVMTINKSVKDISQLTLNTDLAPKIGSIPMNKEVVILPNILVEVSNINNDILYLNGL
ncbi:MAG: hypothetical protein BWK73_44565 [Thiothrix lacustris]|uniref:Uncharacterized protein n=1 Tax=Thiothrix lacustris TaxID=525917 RepID=A0A1Y1QBM1_9GAMM|nr:MAG: hypothetical protein BWK73_44565 [Thiothrix lacustris]